MSTRSLLICGAHPDDETLYAGTMAKYRSEGARVTLICGTRGERGSTAGLCSIEELPLVREAELRHAVHCLGLAPADVHFLPCEDQQLGKAPLDEVRAHMAQVIRSVRPQVVVSFDPQGGNGHTDHIAMARFTSEAIAVAADGRWFGHAGEAWQVQRLLWAPVFQPWAVDPALDVPTTPGVDFLIDTRGRVNQKTEAIRAHRTQLPGLGTLFFKKNSPDLTLHQEAYRLAWGPRPSAPPCGDLFDGL